SRMSIGCRAAAGSSRRAAAPSARARAGSFHRDTNKGGRRGRYCGWWRRLLLHSRRAAAERLAGRRAVFRMACSSKAALAIGVLALSRRTWFADPAFPAVVGAGFTDLPDLTRMGIECAIDFGRQSSPPV